MANASLKHFVTYEFQLDCAEFVHTSNVSLMLLKQKQKNLLNFLGENPDGKRGKRGLLNVVGKASKYLFGTYPYVTSSNCSIGGVCTGLGLPPSTIGEVVGVVKAYTTRVGDGPFPTELDDATGDLLQERGHEIGVTTKRVRRCGWLDIPVLQYTAMVNGYSSLCLTKLDILDTMPKIRIGVSYLLNGEKLDRFPSNAAELAKVKVDYIELPGWEKNTESVRKYDDLPDAAKRYIEKIEELLQVPVKWIGIDKGRESIITVY